MKGGILNSEHNMIDVQLCMEFTAKKEVVVLTSVLVTSVALHDYNLPWYSRDM